MRATVICFMFVSILLFNSSLYADYRDDSTTSITTLQIDTVSDTESMPINVTISESELEKQIIAGKKLTDIGMTLWESGLFLQIIGSGLLGVLPPGDEGDAAGGILLFGMILEFFGPIPSCIGEGKVLKAVSLYNRSHGQHRKIPRQSGWAYWAGGVTLDVIALGLLFSAMSQIFDDETPDAEFTGMYTSLACAMVLRGFAAIHPRININKISAPVVHVSPVLLPDGGYGVTTKIDF